MKTIHKILWGFALFLQAAAMIAIYVAEELTHKKAGVNHHLYYRRAQFNSTVLTEDRILILTIVLIAAIAALLFLLLKKKNASLMLKISFGTEILWMAATLSACYLDLFRSSYAYPYMMAAFALCVILAAIQILLARKS